MHTPVLLKEVINYLKVKKEGLYIDATFGEGSYSREIIKEGGLVLAIDLDKRQIDQFGFKDEHLKIVSGNFRDIKLLAKKYNFLPVDGIVFDLGLSLSQLKEKGRGFSFENLEDPLDMRMDQGQALTAKDLIKKLTVEELYQILAKFSEEKKSFVIAQAIKKKKKLDQVKDLLEAIDSVLTKEKNTLVYRRVFQALRMAVNNEIENLESGLKQGFEILKEKGRLLVITFHSVEDRVVKRFIKNYHLKIEKDYLIFGERNLTYEDSAKLRVIIKKV